MDEKICQSCGLPMSVHACGTNNDGTNSDKYCSNCFQKGLFTNDLTIDDMIEVSVPQMVKCNTGMCEADARVTLHNVLPTLERWK